MARNVAKCQGPGFQPQYHKQQKEAEAALAQTLQSTRLTLQSLSNCCIIQHGTSFWGPSSPSSVTCHQACSSPDGVDTHTVSSLSRKVLGLKHMLRNIC